MRDTAETKSEREKRIVGMMICLYCRKRHGSRSSLCAECRELNEYARSRIDACPFMATKTFCTNCRVHCYTPVMRERIRQVMRFSGPRMVLRHPVVVIRHLLEMRKERRRLHGTDDSDKSNQR